MLSYDEIVKLLICKGCIGSNNVYEFITKNDMNELIINNGELVISYTNNCVIIKTQNNERIVATPIKLYEKYDINNQSYSKLKFLLLKTAIINIYRQNSDFTCQISEKSVINNINFNNIDNALSGDYNDLLKLFNFNRLEHKYDTLKGKALDKLCNKLNIIDQSTIWRDTQIERYLYDKYIHNTNEPHLMSNYLVNNFKYFTDGKVEIICMLSVACIYMSKNKYIIIGVISGSLIILSKILFFTNENGNTDNLDFSKCNTGYDVYDLLCNTVME